MGILARRSWDRGIFRFLMGDKFAARGRGEFSAQFLARAVLSKPKIPFPIAAARFAFKEAMGRSIPSATQDGAKRIALPEL